MPRLPPVVPTEMPALPSCSLSFPAESQGKVPLCPLCDVASWKIGQPIFRGIGPSLKETTRQKGNTRGSLACRVPPFAIWVIMLSSSSRRTSTGVESNRLPWLGGLRTATWKGEINQRTHRPFSPRLCRSTERNAFEGLGNLLFSIRRASVSFRRKTRRRDVLSPFEPLFGYRSIVSANDFVNGCFLLWLDVRTTPSRWLKHARFFGQTRAESFLCLMRDEGNIDEEYVWLVKGKHCKCSFVVFLSFRVIWYLL